MSFFWGSKKQKAVEPSTSQVAKPGAPLELVRYSTDTGKFEVPDEALEVLRSLNGPVGVVWLDLSKEHYGIHGTPEPQNIGRTQSHGCIRLANWDAARLALMVKPGVKAVFQA